MKEIEITWDANRKLVAFLSQAGARFVVVGSTALRFHVPESREPNDLDLHIEPSPEGLAKLNAALAHVGAPTIVATPEQFAQPSKGYRDRRILNADILTPPAGVDFAEHWASADEAIMVCSSTRVRVASVETLRALLRLAQTLEPTRAQDIAKDLELLERAARLPRA